MALSTHIRPHCISHQDWTEITLREFQELNRLVHLNGALQGKGPSRIPVFEMISQDHWDRARVQRNLTITHLQPSLAIIDPKTPKEKYIESLADKVNGFVADYLDKYITDDPKSKLQFFQDLATIQSQPPADKTMKGCCGPTFIISYPRFAPRENGLLDKGVSCVLKYTDLYEVASHRFLEAIATSFTMQRNVSRDEFFCVPQMTVFDLNSGSIGEIRDCYSVDAKITKQFEEVFENFIANYHLSPQMLPSRKKVIARFEKVPAQNFPEFLISHYDSLPKDVKMSMFRRLGRIAYLDFVMGNNDRLLPFEPTQLDFANGEANLGNLMASRSKDGINLFAIDNGINTFLSQGENQEMYLRFLKRVLSSPQFEQFLAFLIKNAIMEGLKNYEHLELFRKDLESVGLIEIQNGIKKMDSAMASQLSASKTFTLDLSRIHDGVANSLNDRVSAAAEASNARRKEQEQKDLSPLRRPICRDLFGALDLQTGQNSDLNLIWNMHQHSRGSLDDENFFKATIVPQSHDDTSIREVYTLFHNIRMQGKNPENLNQLRELTEKVARDIFQVNLHKDSPCPQQSAPTPNSSERSSHTPPLATRNGADTPPFLSRRLQDTPPLVPKRDPREETSN